MRRRILLVPFLLLVALLVAACGSSGSSSSSSGSSGSSSESSSESSEGSGSAQKSAAYEEAIKRVEAFHEPNTSIGITEPVKSVEPGLKIAWVQCSSVACAQAGEGMEEAAQALGAEFKSWADQDTPTTVKSGMNSAMQWEPSMIITSSNDPAWYKGTLTEAEEKGIPVVTFALPGSYKQPGIVINYEPAEDLYFRGVLMTDYAIAQTHGEAHILYMTDSDYAVLEAMNEGVEQEIERVCPETCSVTTQSSTSADLESGKNVSQTVDLARRNPETNFMIASFGGFLSSQLYSALSSAGLEQIPSVSQASTAQNYELMNSDGGQVADVGLPLPYLGYLSIDAGLRALVGQGPQVVTIKKPYMEIEGHPEMGKAFPPTQILEKGAIKDPNEPWTPIVGFQQQFYKLWGVS
jgi:ABC-type sugar transport system substrate-binding protein